MTANRFIDLGYASKCLLRTDLGDDEGVKEWAYGRLANNKDPIGDDAVEIVLSSQGNVTVGYEGRGPVSCSSVSFPAPTEAP